MKTKHTPGEWRINRTGQDNIVHITARRDNDRQDIATIETPTEAETIADAKLIAAAPDLLNALNALIEDIEYSAKSIPMGAIGTRQINAAKAAILKATT